MFMQRLLKPEYAPATRHVLTRHGSNAGDNADRAIDILARTLWGEARGEALPGVEAVANVIVNRVTHAQRQNGFWWGNDVISVCQKPYQFSCWLKSDPNFLKLQHVGADDRVFAMCQRIARRAVNGILTDRTRGATHYHADTLYPHWATDVMPTVTIGHHIFYRIIG